jgi:alginate O-acetyltransferase complex protein AlgI
MLFNSWAFIVFLPCVFAAYWMVNRWTAAPAGLRLQNALLLLASYVFYGWWDVRFLALIALSTGVDYFIGRKIHACNNEDLPAGAPAEARSPRAKRWLVASVVGNLGMLVYFKYANFFLESWVNAWASIGVSMETRSVQVILPVGISF